MVYQTEDDDLSRQFNKMPFGSLTHEINKLGLDKSEMEHTIAPVAWIIIFGEGLHNFIDGLSIGAAFTDSIINGVSLSLAIICEEFPHKLGIQSFFDFTFKQNTLVSFFFNFRRFCNFDSCWNASESSSVLQFFEFMFYIYWSFSRYLCG